MRLKRGRGGRMGGSFMCVVEPRNLYARGSLAICSPNRTLASKLSSHVVWPRKNPAWV